MQIPGRGLDMAYTDTAGAGIPLLLIHAFPLDRTMWAAQTRGLIDVARVIAPDLRGFGASSLPKGAVAVDTYADDVLGLVDALGVGKAVIGGLSMGGYIAFAFYRKHATRVRALILADTRPQADTPEGKKARESNVALVRQKGPAALAEQMLPKLLTAETLTERPLTADAVRALMERQPASGLIAALLAMRDRPDSTPTLAQITAPTLVLVGAEDTLTTPQDAEAMRAGIRGSRLVVIPGAAHLSSYEQPEAFNLATREFLQGII